MRESEMNLVGALGALVLAFGDEMPNDEQLAALKQYTTAVREDEREKAAIRAEAVEVWNRDSADAKRDVVEAIRHA